MLTIDEMITESENILECMLLIKCSVCETHFYIIMASNFDSHRETTFDESSL